MSENIPIPVEEPASSGTARSAEAHTDVQVPRLSMPITWVVTLLVFVVGGSVSIMNVWMRTEARADDAQVSLHSHSDDSIRHLSPQIAHEGGVVTKKTLRTVLRKMSISCRSTRLDDGTSGMTCAVTVPEEAE